MRSEEEARRAVELYSDTVWRVCMIYLKNNADAEDIFQTVFLKYILYSGSFENPQHEKSWFIRVTINCCKDLLRSFFRRNFAPLELAENLPAKTGDNAVLEAVRTLPQNYRSAVYLSYYEGYTAAEIGRLLGKNENTIYTWLSRARGLLREKLGGEALA